jgi:hypothetical protein
MARISSQDASQEAESSGHFKATSVTARSSASGVRSS